MRDEAIQLRHHAPGRLEGHSAGIGVAADPARNGVAIQDPFS